MIKNILLAIGRSLLITLVIGVLGYLAVKYEWLQNVYMGIAFIIGLAILFLGGTKEDEGYSTYTGPRGGKYRISDSGKSKVYITKS
jgi:hypothetical protein